MTFLTAIRSTTAAAALGLAFSGAAAAEIVIGSTLSITGPASFVGAPEAKTLELMVADINENGGVLGQPLRLVQYDDAANPNSALTFATRLVEDDEVVAVIGGSTTGTTMAMIPLFEEAEVPFISLAGAVAIIDPVKPFTFKTPHTDRMACEKIFEDMTGRGIDKIGILSSTGGFGRSMRAECVEAAPGYGIEVVADETHGASDTDMTPQLTNIRNAEGVQAILTPGFDQDAVIVMRNIAQLEIDLPVYQSHAVATDAFLELAGSAADGVRLPSPPLLVADQLGEDDPQKPVLIGYRTMYEEAADEPASTFGGYAHDALRILVEAIERAGSTDPVAIRDAIEGTEGFVGTAGIVTYGPDDHLGLDLSAFRMIEAKDGAWAAVD